MNEQDDYLWSMRVLGQRHADDLKDDATRQLERLLSPLAHSPKNWNGPALSAPRSAPRSSRLRWALAAMLASCALAVALLLQYRLVWPTQRAWALAATQGRVLVNGAPVRAGGRLSMGGELMTAADGAARLDIARIGELRLGASSRLRLEQTRAGQHRVRLLQGHLWARVWAPPGYFGVRLPQAEALDMGCEFTLDSDANGAGLLRVHSGWVLLGNGRGEVLVPQGAQVRLRADGVPGTPYDLGASTGFVAALAALDAQPGVLPADGAGVRRLLAQARPQDVISVLTLLQHHPQLADGPLYDHLLRQFPVAAPSRTAVRHATSGALEPWWNALPYPRAKRWWLQWPDALPARPGRAPSHGEPASKQD